MPLKVVVVTLVSLLLLKTVRSQSDEILIQGQTGSLHLQHTVAAKENWYSIGRMYNLTPKELAPYNKLDMTKPLSIGQELQIPLTAANFSQNGVKAAGETLVPLYHVVQEKEWMYRISVNHNKVAIANLEKWNNINKDQVKAGMHLIVGYLKVKTALSALATKGTGDVAGGTKPAGAVDAGKTTPKTEGVKDTANRAGTTGGAKPVTTGGVKPSTTGETKPVTAETKPLVVTETKRASTETKPAAAETKPVVTETKPVVTETKPAATETKPPVTATEKPAATAEVKTVSGGKSFNGGYFRSEFTDGGKSAMGQAGIFKSTSGWQDGKYYALMNNIPVGTIVKVTDEASGKTIYAKVLGQLPDMKESAGLTIRVSNAAASELGAGDGKFNVDVRY